MNHNLLKIAVTGVSGFVGHRFMEYNRGRFDLLPISLRNMKPSEVDLQGIDTIVHLAGKAHDIRNADEKEYFEINFGLTRELAEHAIKNGVRHFIFISSVKVYGDNSNDNDEDSPCCPTDAYGKSKLKAEQFLLSEATDLFAVAIVRPALVYGPGVKGNLYRLLKLAEKNIPLPFAGIGNLRSMVFIDNLVELINCVIIKRADGIFVAADREPISTTKLVGLLRENLGKKRQLFHLPQWCSALVGSFKPDLHKRLFGSLVIHNKKTCDRLNFKPPFTTEFGLKQMADWWQRRTKPVQHNGIKQEEKKELSLGTKSTEW